LKMLKGKQIELETMGGQFTFNGVILGECCFTFVSNIIMFMTSLFVILFIYLLA
jgi:hypothetical protein